MCVFCGVGRKKLVLYVVYLKEASDTLGRKDAHTILIYNRCVSNGPLGLCHPRTVVRHNFINFSSTFLKKENFAILYHQTRPVP